MWTPVEIEVMAAYSPSTGSDRKLCSLTITIVQLRALLAEIDRVGKTMADDQCLVAASLVYGTQSRRRSLSPAP